MKISLVVLMLLLYVYKPHETDKVVFNKHPAVLKTCLIEKDYNLLLNNLKM